jgi:hypothetical protein
MTTIESPRMRRLPELLVPELWASVAIVAMWLAVLFDAVYGPNIVSTSGSNATTIPSSVVVAFFAFLGTRVVARCGFRTGGD